MEEQPRLNQSIPIPLGLAPFTEGSLCHGFHWAVLDIDALAQLVARVLLGQHRYVAAILEGKSRPNGSLRQRMIDSTIAKLQVDEPKLREHRDGWLFQIVAWIAARIAAGQESASCAFSAPHPRPANKGFDGLIIQIEDSGSRSRGVTISEEKASDNGRKVIQAQIFPDFASCEAGDRDTELMHELTTVLEAHGACGVDDLLEEILWKCERSYRISVTAPSGSSAKSKCNTLFKDYDAVIPGAVARRRAELLFLQDLRGWMNAFSEKLIGELQNLRPESDV